MLLFERRVWGQLKLGLLGPLSRRCGNIGSSAKMVRSSRVMPGAFEVRFKSRQVAG